MKAITVKKQSMFKVILAFALAAIMSFALIGCSGEQEESVVSEEVAAAADDLHIVSMKGATSIGLASMMQQEQGQFKVVAAADEAASLLMQDEADIALVPANLAATLYKKTEGKLRVIDANTLGVLYVVTADASIDSLESLAGRIVYMTGKGTVPEYTLSALLEAKGMSMDDIDVQFKSEPTEVAACMAQNPEAIAILPQPYATALCVKDPSIQMKTDLSKEWEAVFDNHSSIVTGVTVAKASVVEENPEVIAEFLNRHAASAAEAVDNPAAIAETVADLGIIDNAAIAEKAIPYCNVVCLTGSDMKDALQGYLEALYDQNPVSVGGALPEDTFYYAG